MERNNVQSPGTVSASEKPTLAELIAGAGSSLEIIKLPEWGGFWLKTKNETFVFTKDGLLLNTPDVETYGSRLDWIAIHTLEDSTLSLLSIGFVKAVRVKLDLVMNTIKEKLSKNRETALAITSIQSAFMWLGLVKGAVGSANPYPKSMDKNSPVIERHTDLAIDNPEHAMFETIDGLDETGVTKALRQDVQRLINICRVFFICVRVAHNNEPNAYPNSMSIDRSLVEAKLWLGQNLNNIRVQKEGENNPKASE
jgi:hypothetical protein